MSRILITDGEQRASLAVVRSLGRAGHDVIVCSARRRSLAAASRYAGISGLVPAPLDDPGGFAQAVASLGRANNADAVVPVTEASALALLGSTDCWLAARIPLPDLPQFRRMCDKQEVLGTAASLGIAVPAQHVIRTRADVQALLHHDVLFPLVLKPSRSVGEANGTRRKNDVRHAADAAQLEERLASYSDAAFPVLAQQRIDGPGIGVSMLRWDGEVKAAFVHQRLREKPPSGGVSVYRESIAPDEGLVVQSSRLLAALEWQGVAMVEYKVRAHDGVPFLMEINPRFWGSLQLAIDAGVDFPTLLLRCAAGETVRPVTSYAVGVRSRWWWGEMDHLITRLRHAPYKLDLTPDAPGRLAAVRAFLQRDDRDRNEVWQRSDPWPLLRESVDWLMQRG